MSRLSQAPLIEAIFEVRWGSFVQKDPKTVTFDCPEDQTFFPGRFSASASQQGFTFVEKINDAPLPHVIQHRFRKEPNTWPCYQIGMGVFTVNQLNEGYDWESYKEDILTGVKLLRQSSEKEIIPQYVELRYQDAFPLEKSETPTEFLANKLNFGFNPPEDFLGSQYLTGKPKGHHIAFHIDTVLPKGALIFVLQEAIVNGKPGFVMDTMMRSPSQRLGKTLETWLEQAHDTQRHAFRTLIKPAYLRSFE